MFEVVVSWDIVLGFGIGRCFKYDFVYGDISCFELLNCGYYVIIIGVVGYCCLVFSLRFLFVMEVVGYYVVEINVWINFFKIEICEFFCFISSGDGDFNGVVGFCF